MVRSQYWFEVNLRLNSTLNCRQPFVEVNLKLKSNLEVDLGLFVGLSLNLELFVGLPLNRGLLEKGLDTLVGS